MPELKAELSVSSLDNLLSDLNSYKEKLEMAPQKIEADIAEIGASSIEDTLSNITDQDGNSAGTVGIEETENGIKVFNQGKQIAFLEYGTGEKGVKNSHPYSGKANWKYNSGTKIRHTKNGKRMWKYWDRLRGHWRITNGIPAQMQVYNAALKMREEIPHAAKEALK